MLVYIFVTTLFHVHAIYPKANCIIIFYIINPNMANRVVLSTFNILKYQLCIQKIMEIPLCTSITYNKAVIKGRSILYSLDVSTFSVCRALKLATLTCVTKVYNLFTESSSSFLSLANLTRILNGTFLKIKMKQN